MRKIIAISLAVVVLSEFACVASDTRNSPSNSGIPQKTRSQLLAWEDLGAEIMSMRVDRAKVPGGWIVRSSYGQAIAQTFVPDSAHSWQIGDSAK